MKKIRGRAAVILVVSTAVGLVVSGCAETNLAIHAAKQIQGRDAPGAAGAGAYKVGFPYQVDGVWYYPKIDYEYSERGIASWYGTKFHGRPTANGEFFDMNELTAAHRTLPLPSVVRVTNLENGRALVLRVNDRGPFRRGRIIDVSRRAAQLLGFDKIGTARVEVQILADESRQLAMLGGRNTIHPADRIAPPAAPPPSMAVEPLSSPVGSIQPVSAQLGGSQDIGVGGVRQTALTTAPKYARGAVTVTATRPTSIFVQAGAFLSYDSAEQLRRSLAGIARTEVSRTSVGEQPFFRVRLGPLQSVASADNVLERVVASGYPSARVIVE